MTPIATSARYRAVEPEQRLQRHPEAGSSWPSWPQTSHREAHAHPRQMLRGTVAPLVSGFYGYHEDEEDGKDGEEARTNFG